MMSNQAAKEIQAKKNMPKKWQGLKPARFAKYRSWINSGTPVNQAATPPGPLA